MSLVETFVNKWGLDKEQADLIGNRKSRRI